MIEYKRSNTVKEIGDLEFNAEILTSGHWPYQEAPKCVIPKSLEVAKGSFTKYYKAKFANREICGFTTTVLANCRQLI